MKQHLSKYLHKRGECPVRCPVCSYENAPYPVHFKRLLLRAHESTTMQSDRANIILFLIYGKLNIQHDSHEFQIRSRHAVFFRRNAKGRIYASDKSEIIWLEFSNRIVLGVTDILSLSAAHTTLRPEKISSILELREPLLGWLQNLPLFNSPCYYLNLQHELYILMKYIYNEEEVMRFFHTGLQSNDDFRAFVIDNYHYNDTLENIAHKANMSINNFLRRFKSEFGITAHQWLVKQKARKFLQAIAAGQYDPKSLTRHFGFNSPAGLYIFCRRQFGKSLKELIHEASVENKARPSIHGNGDFCAKKGDF